jgi:hypothetical protein
MQRVCHIRNQIRGVAGMRQRLRHCPAQGFIIFNDQYPHVCQFRVSNGAHNARPFGG